MLTLKQAIEKATLSTKDKNDSDWASILSICDAINTRTD